MLSQALIAKNKKRLEQEQERLEQLLSRIARPNPTAPGGYQAKYEDVGSQEDENAAEVAQFEANLAEERDLEARLNKVKAALERIAQGAYGICASGGEAIPENRLQAVPEADTCIEHASKK